MRTAVSVGIFSVLLLTGTAGATDRQPHKYATYGFSADFTGTVREIDLKPDEGTRRYIARTSIFEQHDDCYSFSITAREYLYGMPNIAKIAQIIESRIGCSRQLKDSFTEGAGLTIHGEQCLSNSSILYARLVGRGRWFYQAMAIVARRCKMDGEQFVGSLRLQNIEKERTTAQAASKLISKTNRKSDHGRKRRQRAAVIGLSAHPSKRLISLGARHSGGSMLRTNRN
jgi:hypothetical protein